MSVSSICFTNSSVVVIVARIVSPGWVCSFWNVRAGVAVAIEISSKDSKNVAPLFIINGGFSD